MDTTRENRILRVLEEDPTMILLLKNKYITETMWTLCIQKEPRLFRFNKNPSETLCYLALEEDGSNLEWLLKNRTIKVTQKMIMTAIRSYPAAICYLKPSDVSDDLKMYACLLDPSLMKHFSSLPEGFAEQRVLSNPALLKFVEHPSEDLICEAIRLNPNACAYIETFTPRIKALIEELYPEFIPLLPALREESLEQTTNIPH